MRTKEEEVEEEEEEAAAAAEEEVAVEVAEDRRRQASAVAAECRSAAIQAPLMLSMSCSLTPLHLALRIGRFTPRESTRHERKKVIGLFLRQSKINNSFTSDFFFSAALLFFSLC